MDEPLSNLDAKLRVETRAGLIKLHQRLQTTTIYVTHDQVEAMTMGHRIAVLREGLLQQLDTPQALYDRPANLFVAGFIGSPAMNFLPGRLVTEPDGAIWGQADGLKLKFPESKRARLQRLQMNAGRDVVLGIRPEHIHHPVEVRDGRDDATGNVNVSVVEMLGSDVNVYVSTGDRELVAVMDRAHAPKPGDNLQLVFDTDKLYVFDPETEKALI